MTEYYDMNDEIEVEFIFSMQMMLLREKLRSSLNLSVSFFP